MIVKTSQWTADQAFGFEALQSALATLGRAGVIPRAAIELERSMQDAGNAMREEVLAQIPAFTDSHNPDILPGLKLHAEAHLREILRLMGGGPVGRFDFVQAHARLRAEQRFPLESTLHAYRCGQKVFSRWLRDAAIALKTAPRKLEKVVAATADFSIEYTNAVSTIATSAYVAHTRMLALAEGDLRMELLSILLSGYDESDGRVARLLRQAGYLEQRQSYCVVVAQSTNVLEMEHPERAQRIIRALAAQIAPAPIRLLAGIRNNLVTAVLSAARRQSGWTAAQATLPERIDPMLQLLGPAVRIGISADHPSTAFLPRALQEATHALDFASVADRVVQFSKLPIRSLLVHRGADQVRATPPPWVAPLLDADKKAAGMLVQTLRAMAEADLNVQKAARTLGKHPNTVYARLERIRDLSGLDGQRYRDLTELLLAADCWPP
ncbi:MAG: helix-turn-helix domain-containing protein [Burkholderiaceae bacterium]|nr:helix-turn-helix domain-containing protein [Burkholderiaceae bacterium]